MKLAVRNNERDRKIVMYREKGGKSFVDIGKEFNITKGRVRQIYERAVRERQEAVNKKMGIGG